MESLSCTNVLRRPNCRVDGMAQPLAPLKLQSANEQSFSSSRVHRPFLNRSQHAVQQLGRRAMPTQCGRRALPPLRGVSSQLANVRLHERGGRSAAQQGPRISCFPLASAVAAPHPTRLADEALAAQSRRQPPRATTTDGIRVHHQQTSRHDWSPPIVRAPRPSSEPSRSRGSQ